MNTDNSWSRCANEFGSLIDDLDEEFPSTAKPNDSQVRPRRRRNSKGALSSRKSVVATDIALANIEQIESTELVSRWIAHGICTPASSDRNPSSPSADIFSELVKSPVIKCRPRFVRRRTRSGRTEKKDDRSPHLMRPQIIREAKFCRKKRRRFDSSSERKKADKSRSSTPITSQVDSDPLMLNESCHSLRKKQPRIECKELQNQLDLPIGAIAHRYFELGDLSAVNDLNNCERNSRSTFTESKAVSAAKTNEKALRFGSIELSQDCFDEDRATKSSLPFNEEETLLLTPRKEETVKRNFLFVDVNFLSSLSENTEPVFSADFKTVLSREGLLCGFRKAEDLEGVHDPPAKKTSVQLDATQLSQDLFDDEPELSNPESIHHDENQLRRISELKEEEARPVSSHREGIHWLKTEDDNKEEILGDPKANLWPCRPEEIDRYSPEIKVERDSCESEIADFRSFKSFIQDTEEVVPSSRGKDCGKLITGTPNSSDSIKQEEKFSILDSEFSPGKKQFVTDTERIDYDTSSENGEGDPNVNLVKINISDESDSDRTVSDIIEEPLTQEYVEPSKPAGLASGSSLNSISAVTSKVSETISLATPLFNDISIETTPPIVQESFTAIPEHIFSTKKKRSRPKKGSLSARLQKLVSGQVSYVRLWRYQISHDSVFQQSSTMCVTLMVLQSWVQYEKNLYLSRVLEDSHGLLNDCFGEMRGEENRERSLVVMTNPEFVRAVKMLPGTVFKVYSPWKIFDRYSEREDPIMHALYLQVVPIQAKEKANSTESLAANDRLKNKVIHEYDCPCLQNGKVDDSCTVKFSNQKVNVMDVIFNEK